MNVLRGTRTGSSLVKSESHFLEDSVFLSGGREFLIFPPSICEVSSSKVEKNQKSWILMPGVEAWTA